MTIHFSMNCTDLNQQGCLSLLRNLLDKLEKTVGSNHFKSVELELDERYADAANSSKMASIKISSDTETFADQSVSKNWQDAMLNAFDFVQKKIELALVKPITGIA